MISVFFCLMIRRPPRSTLDRSSAASDVYKRQIWSPLASGVLSGKHSLEGDASSRLRAAGLDWLRERELTEARLKKVDELKAVAMGLDLSLPVFAIAWCLKNPRVSTVILGASKTTQLEENLKAVSYTHLTLPTSDLV